MAEYYRTEKKHSVSKSRDKVPYRKIFVRQIIAAILCFLIINYLCNDSIKIKLKEIINYNIDTTKTLDFFNQMKINGADTNETETETKL